MSFCAYDEKYFSSMRENIELSSNGGDDTVVNASDKEENNRRSSQINDANKWNANGKWYWCHLKGSN